MKRAIVLLSCLGVLAGVPVFAATVTVHPGDKVVVEPAQRKKIKEYITKEKIAPMHVNKKVVVGEELPPDVELRPVPPDWGPEFAKYRYIYSNDHVYLVQPSDREVIEEID